jgi:hypothetical protein
MITNNFKKHQLQILIFISLTAQALTSNAQNLNDGCFLNFKPYTDISISKFNRLPITKVNYRQLPTASGYVKISQQKGTRIIFNNKKQAPFINLKVEMSEPTSYEHDQQGVIQHFSYLVTRSKNIKDNKLNKIELNGYTLYGYTTKDFEKSLILSSYVFFPKKNVIVYIDFHNLKQADKSYSSIADFIKQRDFFLNAYTLSAKKCSAN